MSAGTSELVETTRSTMSAEVAPTPTIAATSRSHSKVMSPASAARGARRLALRRTRGGEAAERTAG